MLTSSTPGQQPTRSLRAGWLRPILDRLQALRSQQLADPAKRACCASSRSVRRSGQSRITPLYGRAPMNDADRENRSSRGGDLQLQWLVHIPTGGGTWRRSREQRFMLSAFSRMIRLWRIRMPRRTDRGSPHCRRQGAELQRARENLSTACWGRTRADRSLLMNPIGRRPCSQGLAQHERRVWGIGHLVGIDIN